MFSRTRSLGVATLLLLLAVACSEDEPLGTLSDPAGVTADVSALDSVFASPVFESFGVMSQRMPGIAGAAAAGTLPRRRLLSQTPEARSAEDVRALARLAPLFSAAAPQDSFLPDSVLGTYEWDTTASAYAKTARPGAPANTIRFILYKVDSLTGEPAVPLDEVGYADLTDNQPVGTNASLGIVVRDSAGTTTYLDYDLTVSLTASGITMQTAGFVADGVGHQMDFSIVAVVTGNNTQALVSIDADFSLNQPDVGVEVRDRASLTATTITVTRDFRLHRGTETIRITGTVTITENPPGTLTVTLTVVVRVNGGIFATITGNGTVVTVTKADGTALTADEQAALAALIDATDAFWSSIETLFEPSEVMLGS